MKKDFYPDMKKPVRLEENEGASIEVHLLHRKFEQEAGRKEGNRGTVSMEKIRQTFMNNLQSKRFV